MRLTPSRLGFSTFASALVLVILSPAGCAGGSTAPIGDDAGSGGDDASSHQDAGCPSGKTQCDTGCVDTKVSTQNCGSCGNTCKSNETCSGGTCQANCQAPTPTKCAGGDAGGFVCTDTTSDANNCGSCGKTCPPEANADPSCTNGTCGIACHPGFLDCDGDPSNGCEVNQNTDPANCGSCSNACPKPANATAACTQGQCGIGTCDPNYADCNKDPKDGCEVNLLTDNQNCKTCGNKCPVNTPACSNGVCVAGCTGTLLGTFGNQKYYRVQVSGAMTDTNVYNACLAGGCHTPCDADANCQYNDNLCKLGAQNMCTFPMRQLSYQLCGNGIDPSACAQLYGTYQYMGHKWLNNDTCGAEQGLWCTQGSGQQNKFALCVE
jgi:hypothetical protein